MLRDLKVDFSLEVKWNGKGNKISQIFYPNKRLIGISDGFVILVNTESWNGLVEKGP